MCELMLAKKKAIVTNICDTSSIHGFRNIGVTCASHVKYELLTLIIGALMEGSEIHRMLQSLLEHRFPKQGFTPCHFL